MANNEAKKFESVNLVLGSSTAFGVGATDDAKTLSSELSRLNGEPWLNLSIRGCVSFQELINLFNLLHELPEIKIL